MTRRGGKKPPAGGRNLQTRVLTAKGRKASSTRWLQRQLNDPYVAAAGRAGYRSRAAFKLGELDDRFKFLKRGARVVDLGAAPGGWSQIAAERAGNGGKVIALDILEMAALPGVEVLTLDFTADDAPQRLIAALGGQADVVLSDMAPNLTGHAKTDHLRIIALVEAAYEFATGVLAPGGAFVAKVFQGGTEAVLLADMKRRFATVRHAKPPASRAESAEVFVVAMGFKAGATANKGGSDG
jgi:23S rRNA (uridine2552-2'-O)-methyltransferase